MEVLWQPGMTIEEVEEMVIKKAFSFYLQNKTHTANSLGIAIRTLDNKLKKYEENDAAIRKKINGATKKAEAERQKSRNNAEAGFRMEPPKKVSSQPGVPVHVGEKVQEVSRSDDSVSGDDKGCDGLPRAGEGSTETRGIFKSLMGRT